MGYVNRQVLKSSDRLILIFLILGIFLRFYGFWNSSLWADEVLYLEIQRFDFLHRITIWFVKVILQNFPSLDAEFVIRFPYVVMSSLSLVVLAKIAKLFGRDEELVSFILFCSSFFMSIIGQEATAWSMACFFYLLSCLEFMKILQDENRGLYLFFIYSLASIFSKEITALWVIPLIFSLYLKRKIDFKYILLFIFMVLIFAGIMALVISDKFEISKNYLILLRETFKINIFSSRIYLDTFMVFSGSWWQITSYLFLIFSTIGFFSAKDRKEILYLFILPSVSVFLLTYILFGFFSPKYLLPLFLAYIITISKGIIYVASFVSKKLKFSRNLTVLFFISIFILSNLRTFYEYWRLKMSFFLPLDISGVASDICRTKNDGEEGVLIKFVSPVKLIKFPVSLGLGFYLRRCGIHLSILEEDKLVGGVIRSAGKLEVIERYMENEKKKKYLIFLIPLDIDSSGILRWWVRKDPTTNRLEIFIRRILHEEDIMLNNLYVKFGIIMSEVSDLSEPKIQRIDFRFKRFFYEFFLLRTRGFKKTMFF
ncbi:MAG: hypothetical protein QXJ20_02830 [Candidatus Aenigmatarchaeota archaeon]